MQSISFRFYNLCPISLLKFGCGPGRGRQGEGSSQFEGGGCDGDGVGRRMCEREDGSKRDCARGQGKSAKARI
jgi:hypothetical protein